MGLAACSSDSGASGSSSATSAKAASPGEIPTRQPVPIPGDGSNGPDVLEESGIVRSDIRSSFGDASGTAGGVPMTLELALSDLANGGSAFAGVAVYVWHCDREGRYSIYSEGVEDQNYLRGAQIADDDGIVRFTSIFPACYAGRWPHIHFEVYPDRRASATPRTRSHLPGRAAEGDLRQGLRHERLRAVREQPEWLSLASDNVFGATTEQASLATTTGDVDNGYTVKLAIRVDTSTKPSGGRRPGRRAAGQRRRAPHATVGRVPDGGRAASEASGQIETPKRADR